LLIEQGIQRVLPLAEGLLTIVQTNPNLATMATMATMATCRGCLESSCLERL